MADSCLNGNIKYQMSRSYAQAPHYTLRGLASWKADRGVSLAQCHTQRTCPPQARASGGAPTQTPWSP